MVPRSGFQSGAAFGTFTVTKSVPLQSLLFIAIGSTVIGAGISTRLRISLRFMMAYWPMSREFPAQTSIAAFGVGAAN
ncbi:hypothetical protein [uncultured Sulfitobacter sp.]|uniref:hypothetical protein n=1 Tax=uncultured Sulfitobacter sp. TaxID=191468 RepID=UPI0030DC1242